MFQVDISGEFPPTKLSPRRRDARLARQEVRALGRPPDWGGFGLADLFDGCFKIELIKIKPINEAIEIEANQVDTI